MRAAATLCPTIVTQVLLETGNDISSIRATFRKNEATPRNRIDQETRAKGNITQDALLQNVKLVLSAQLLDAEEIHKQLQTRIQERKGALKLSNDIQFPVIARSRRN